MTDPWQPTLKGFAIAARASLRAHWRISPRQAILKALQTALFLAAQVFRQRVPDELYRRREGACKTCRIYNHTLQTCGTPGDHYHSASTHQIEPRGCLCFQPIKSRFRVNCWLYDKTEGVEGWLNDLNSFPIHRRE